MSECAPTPERPSLSEAQEKSLRHLCERYGVEYAAEHYRVYPTNSMFMPGWAEGWVGGGRHANPDYMKPYEPAGHPTIFVGCSPEGEICS